MSDPIFQLAIISPGDDMVERAFKLDS